MYPREGHRTILHSNSDIIFEKKHDFNYTRICLPYLDTNTVSYIKSFCNFYKCNFSKETFTNQVLIYKEEANTLFKQNIHGNLINKAYLHRKIDLCRQGLKEDWHSPIFVTKINSIIFATTGHNKIYATYLRDRHLNLDFDCFVLDFDKNPENFFINIKDIGSDKEFSNEINSNDFAIDISLEKVSTSYLPCIMQFSKHYPIKYHDGSYDLAHDNKVFFSGLKFTNDKVNLHVTDRYNSIIFD